MAGGASANAIGHCASALRISRVPLFGNTFATWSAEVNFQSQAMPRPSDDTCSPRLRRWIQPPRRSADAA